MSRVIGQMEDLAEQEVSRYHDSYGSIPEDLEKVRETARTGDVPGTEDIDNFLENINQFYQDLFDTRAGVSTDSIHSTRFLDSFYFEPLGTGNVKPGDTGTAASQAASELLHRFQDEYDSPTRETGIGKIFRDLEDDVRKRTQKNWESSIERANSQVKLNEGLDRASRCKAISYMKDTGLGGIDWSQHTDALRTYTIVRGYAIATSLVEDREPEEALQELGLEDEEVNAVTGNLYSKEDIRYNLGATVLLSLDETYGGVFPEVFRGNYDVLPDWFEEP
ncbi:MAG: hypothetical protein ABEJ91_00395 [Candidatus Nanohaloarchaea archaeon]